MEQLITPLTTLGHLAQLAPEQFAAPLKSLVANFIVKDLLMNDRVHSSDKERQGFCWLFCLHIFTVQYRPDITKTVLCKHFCWLSGYILYYLCCEQMPGKKTTKLWVPDDEVSPETLAKVSN